MAGAPLQAAVTHATALLQRGEAAAAARLAQALGAHAPAHLLLACALLQLRNWPGAVTAADAALALLPAAAPAHFVRGTALHALGRPAEAAAALEQAVTLAQDDAAAWLNLGTALTTLDRLADAEAALRRACALDPSSAASRASLGTALVRQLRLPEAIAAYRDALRLAPAFAAARWDLGFALLLAGDFRAGWAAQATRKPEEDSVLRALGVSGPEWDGTAPARSLLVCSSQGLGDAIQFARFLPKLGPRVTLACDARLRPLLRQLDGVSVAHPPPPHDAWISLSSLPRLFAADAHTIPAAAGYLTADPLRVAAWRARLPAGRRIGLVWAGNPAHANDARRSMPLEALAPLLALPGVTCVSLQTGPAATALPDVPAFGAELTDFAETAALLTALDGLVTVDTAAAHLAGALGRPAWVALPHAPDWRWLLGRADSPWYASLRLVRQTRPGDWAGVVATIAADLTAGA